MIKMPVIETCGPCITFIKLLFIVECCNYTLKLIIKFERVNFELIFILLDMKMCFADNKQFEPPPKLNYVINIGERFIW